MKYIIKNVEVEIDMEELEFVEKYEKAHEKAEEDLKAIQSKKTASESIKAKCMLTRNLFDRIFGEGTAKKMFGDTWNARETEKAHLEFLAICQEQQREASERQAKILGSKFLPKK